MVKYIGTHPSKEVSLRAEQGEIGSHLFSKICSWVSYGPWTYGQALVFIAAKWLVKQLLEETLLQQARGTEELMSQCYLC